MRQHLEGDTELRFHPTKLGREVRRANPQQVTIRAPTEGFCQLVSWTSRPLGIIDEEFPGVAGRSRQAGDQCSSALLTGPQGADSVLAFPECVPGMLHGTRNSVCLPSKTRLCDCDRNVSEAPAPSGPRLSGSPSSYRRLERRRQMLRLRRQGSKSARSSRRRRQYGRSHSQCVCLLTTFGGS